MLHRLFDCLNITPLFDCLNSHRMSPALSPLSPLSPLSSTVMRFYPTLILLTGHTGFITIYTGSQQTVPHSLSLYLCWSPPPPPPLPSHHHGLFLCPLRSLSSQYQKTPLHFASSKDVAELLVEKGADVDARDKVRPTLPPTHIAAASLFSRCCPFLTPSLSPFHTGSLLPLLVFPHSRDP